jgi:hypothetical protein
MEPRNEPRQFKTGAKKGEDTSGNETLLESSAMSHVQHYHDVGGSVRDVLSDIRLDMTTYSNLHSWDDPMTKTSGSLIRAACRDYMEIVAGSLDFLLPTAPKSSLPIERTIQCLKLQARRACKRTYSLIWYGRKNFSSHTLISSL